jgi:rhodanese-related sulfurtransferase
MKKSLVAVLASFAMALLSSGLVSAQETPDNLAGGKVITPEVAKQLLDSKTALFVDTRATLNFGKGHIPGAVAIAYKEKSEKTAGFDASQDAFDLTKLPGDKNKPIVFYSDGPSGWKSYKAAVLAIKAGHSKVSYLRSGYSGWTAKNLPIEQ